MTPKMWQVVEPVPPRCCERVAGMADSVDFAIVPAGRDAIGKLPGMEVFGEFTRRDDFLAASASRARRASELTGRLRVVTSAPG